ncbi:hypothetical protein EPH_0031720 [Eimeria praecox]|uniref:Thioredoxin domain-containing protein n=1 Tax=Eimeria praecox TaxID=51316 RepID=U6G6F6_9EIME|nr:hypothetical protein EPH_0031720 [Eimeria praecox]
MGLVSAPIVDEQPQQRQQQQQRQQALGRRCLSRVVVCAEAARPLIDPMKHDIGVVTQSTWSGKVLKFRDTTVFSVLFYRPSDKESRTLIDGEYDNFAKKMKGIVQVLAVDCDESPKLCKDNNATDLPQIIIFPPFPLPAFTFQGTRDVESLSKAVRPLIPSNVKSVANQKELDALIASTVQMPKALFFSDKLTKPSILVKALSNAFKLEQSGLEHVWPPVECEWMVYKPPSSL